MAGNVSNYLENKLLEHAVGKTTFTKPTNVYVALFTVTPTDSGGGTEVSASGYARKTMGASDWGSASGGSIATASDIRFPAASGAAASYGTIVAMGIFDASSAGNLLFYGPLSASVTVGTGDDFLISAGNLVISLD